MLSLCNFYSAEVIFIVTRFRFINEPNNLVFFSSNFLKLFSSHQHPLENPRVKYSRYYTKMYCI